MKLHNIVIVRCWFYNNELGALNFEDLESTTTMLNHEH